MKKNYVTPMAEVFGVEIERLLESSPTSGIVTGVDSGDTGIGIGGGGSGPGHVKSNNVEWEQWEK